MSVSCTVFFTRFFPVFLPFFDFQFFPLSTILGHEFSSDDSVTRFFLLHRNRNLRFVSFRNSPSGLAFQLSIRDRFTRFDLLFISEPLGLRPNGFFFSILFVTHVNILTSDRHSIRNLTDFPFALQNVLLPFHSISWLKITASASYLVSCISGANPLLLYVVTRFFTDGCFQAHRQVVLGSSLPFALSMKFETLSIDLGCFPLNVQYLSTAVGLRLYSLKFIHSLHLIGTLWHALTGTELYLLESLISLQTGTASTAFVENKLSRSLFSLSPLFTTHPRSLQRTLVRPSMNCYIHFSLVMNSSLRFVSLIWEVFFLLIFPQFRFHFVFTFPLQLLPIVKTRWPIIPKVPWNLFLRLQVDIGCPVSCKFPHGTLHYQSRKLSFVLSRRFYFLPSRFHVWIYSDFSKFPPSVRDFSHPL